MEKRLSYVVGAWAIPVLFNGDTSHLDATEEFQIERFMEEVMSHVDEGEYLVWQDEAYPLQFRKCDVSSLWDNCAEIDAIIRRAYILDFPYENHI